jgi:Ca-activated chloride channel homolog
MGTPLISRHLTIAAALSIGCALLLTQCVPALDESDGDDDSSLLSSLIANQETPAPVGIATAGPGPSAQPADPLTRALQQAAPEWNELAAAALVEACENPGQGEVLTWTDGAAWSLPLLHTDVDTVISGMVADITVVQAFANPFDTPIEAVYLFPLPDDAAVDGMTLRIGDRTIEGSIHEREEAAAIYAQAKSEGRVASLLDQERPNIFTQHVANLVPGELVEISIHVVQPLKYEDGGYSWDFPLVVGPRYVPADADPNPRTGYLADLPAARQALDAPYSPTRTGNDVSVHVSVDAGVPIRDVRSPSHDLHVSEPSGSQAEVSLANYDQIPNKDFVLRWSVAGDAPEVAVLADAHNGEGVFMLMIQPPADGAVTPDTVIPKEMVFVVDTSCSMSGFPLDKAKDAMRLAIGEMNPNDRFLVMDFNDRVSTLSASPLANTTTNRQRGLSFVERFHGSGGTRMLDGIEASLDLPQDPELLRTVLFLTDGYIGNEADILSSIEQRLGARTRLFSLGIGSSVNRYLLDRMAKVGRGGVDVVLHAEGADEAVERFYDRIRNPVLSDLSVEVDGVTVHDLTPDPLPDLFTGQPLVLFGRYSGGGMAIVTVTGNDASGPFTQVVEVDLPANAQDHPGLESLWARKTIEDIELRNHGGGNQELTDVMTELALAHGIVTRRTSFVAVDTEISNPGGGGNRLDVPLETPEGVEIEAAAGPLGPDGLARPQRPPPACGVFSTGGYGSGSGSGGMMGSGSGKGYGYGGLGMGGSGTGHGGGGSSSGLGGLGSKGRGTGASGYGRGAARSSASSNGVLSFSGSADLIQGTVHKPRIDFVLSAPRPVSEATPEEPIAGLSPFGTSTPEPDSVATAAPIILGSIDKSVIDRVIKKNLNQVRYCYEKELKTHADIAGKLVVKFTIGAEGDVSEAVVKSSTLGSPAVSACVLGRFLRMQFPAPAGGGIVVVSYPLVFANGG